MRSNETHQSIPLIDGPPRAVRIHVPGPVRFVSHSSRAEFGIRHMLMGIILLSIVAGAVGYSSWCVWLQFQTQSWPQVPGVVRSASIGDQLTTIPPSGRLLRPRPQRQIETTIIDVRYRYEFEGQAFENDAIDRPLNLNVSGSYARHHARKYPAGGAVTVYVNPKKPRESVLQATILAEHLAVMVVIMPLLPCALLIMKRGVIQLLDRVWRRSLVAEKIIEDADAIRVWLPCQGVFRHALIVWAISLAVVAVIISAALLIAYVPISAWWVLLAVLIATGAACMSGFKRWKLAYAPSRAIVIYRQARCVCLPAMADSHGECTLPIDDVLMIEASDQFADVIHTVDRVLPQPGQIREATRLCLLTREHRFTLAIRQEVDLIDRIGQRLALMLSRIKGDQ